MNIKELFEGVEPELPGAPEGIQIMTPQQFIAKSAQGEEPEPEQEVSESKMAELDMDLDDPELSDREFEKIYGMSRREAREEFSRTNTWDFPDVRDPNKKLHEQGVAEGFLDEASSDEAWELVGQPVPEIQQFVKQMGYGNNEQSVAKITAFIDKAQPSQIPSASIPKLKNLANKGTDVQTLKAVQQISGRPDAEQQYTKLMKARDAAEGRNRDVSGYLQYVKSGNYDPPVLLKLPTGIYVIGGRTRLYAALALGVPANVKIISANNFKQGVAEATALPASTRELKGQELTDYLDRIRNQEKKKTDKYNLPYVHRSSVVGYYNAEGKKYNTDAIKAGLKERPKSLLKKNEKMRHSDGAQEQFFNIGFAALVGVALDENTNEIIIVNTCPGAGSCKVDCFAMKGGKVQFAGPWLSDGRILTYLLNHPNEFFEQLKSEITKEAAKGQKGGYSVSIRWHDAGDFFSPEYMDMAFKLAQSLPNVKFYAYTKVASAAMANKPSNFIINWSEGASTSQEKQIKRNDPNLDITKNSRIVPSSLFYDLLVKDAKKNLVKGPEGQWQVIPDELPELKQRLADKYGISKNSILSYDEWNTKGKHNKSMKWNVIVAPGEPDLTANDPGVLSTLLLKH
jgi:hypothetical protein